MHDRLFAAAEEIGDSISGLSELFKTVQIGLLVKEWLEDDISGKECARKIVFTTVPTLGAAAGGMAGAAGGMFFGPHTAIVGGFVGAISAHMAAKRVAKRVEREIFSDSRKSAVKNAYEYFGLQKSATNHEINCKYKELKELHSDLDDQLILYIRLMIIKASRA